MRFASAISACESGFSRVGIASPPEELIEKSLIREERIADAKGLDSPLSSEAIESRLRYLLPVASGKLVRRFKQRESVGDVGRRLDGRVAGSHRDHLSGKEIRFRAESVFPASGRPFDERFLVEPSNLLLMRASGASAGGATIR